MLDQGLELWQLLGGHWPKVVADRRAGAARCEEVADFLERETGPLGGIDHRKQPQNLGPIAPLTGDPFRLGEQADRLVVADGGGAAPGARGDLADTERQLI